MDLANTDVSGKNMSRGTFIIYPMLNEKVYTMNSTAKLTKVIAAVVLKICEDSVFLTPLPIASMRLKVSSDGGVNSSK